MDCTPIDDYCKLNSEFIEILSENSYDDPTELGIFNGKRYSFMMVEGTPVISIEGDGKPTFLMEK